MAAPIPAAEAIPITFSLPTRTKISALFFYTIYINGFDFLGYSFES